MSVTKKRVSRVKCSNDEKLDQEVKNDEKLDQGVKKRSMKQPVLMEVYVKKTNNRHGSLTGQNDQADASESRETNAFAIMMKSSHRSSRNNLDSSGELTPENLLKKNYKRKRKDISPKLDANGLVNHENVKRQKARSRLSDADLSVETNVERDLQDTPKKRKSRRHSSPEPTNTSNTNVKVQSSILMSPCSKRNDITDFFTKISSPIKSPSYKISTVKSKATSKYRRRSENRKLKGTISNGEEANSPPLQKRRSQRKVLCDKNSTNNLSESPDGETIVVIELEDSFNSSNVGPNLDESSQEYTDMVARRNFLLSGIPEKMKLEKINSDKITESLLLLFPSVSHILQNELDNQVVFHFDQKFNVLSQDENLINGSYNSKLSSTTFRSLNIYPNYKNGRKSKYQKKANLPELKNRREMIKGLKNAYEKFPTYRCYNQLKEKQRMSLVRIEHAEVDEVVQPTKFHSNYVEEDPKANFSIKSADVLYTEKFKPANSAEVLVNCNPVIKLKEFLSSWKTRKFKAADGFDMSDSSNSSCNDICNFIVLLGPISSGKTNAVYLLANEMNFKILEINAGMKRNGKKIIQELREATQSHLVKRRDSKLNSKIFAKKYISKDTTEKQNNTEKLSLILIEDADIIFEQDIGFVEAIMQLAMTSKRPVILTANDLNCQHLMRLINQNSIEFPKFNILNISRYLSIMSIVENCPVELDDIIKLYEYNEQNLRKTILEMQFFIQTGGDYITTKPEKKDVSKNCPENEDSNDATETYIHKNLYNCFVNTRVDYHMVPLSSQCDVIWSNMKTLLGESKMLKRNVKQEKRGTSNVALEKLCNFYENMSLMTNLSHHNYPDESSVCLNEGVVHNLAEISIKNILESNINTYDLRRRHHKRSSILEYLQPNKIFEKATALDMEPMLRAICRNERIRSVSERRGIRFYHYLCNVANYSRFPDDFIEENCNIFCEIGKDLS